MIIAEIHVQYMYIKYICTNSFKETSN